MAHRPLVHWLAFLVTFTTSLPAAADWFHKVVRYRCDAESNVLVVTYDGAYNEAGEALIRDKGKDAWNPWDLLRTDRKKERIVGTKAVTKTCVLRDGPYNVTISGIYENPMPTGHCGSHVTAELVVRKAERKLYGDAFEGGCDNMFNSSVVTEVKVTAGSQSPQITKMPGNDFYK